MYEKRKGQEKDNIKLKKQRYITKWFKLKSFMKDSEYILTLSCRNKVNTKFTVVFSSV